MVVSAAALTGLEFTAVERDTMLEDLNRICPDYWSNRQPTYEELK